MEKARQKEFLRELLMAQRRRRSSDAEVAGSEDEPSARQAVYRCSRVSPNIGFVRTSGRHFLDEQESRFVLRGLTQVVVAQRVET